ncbi:MAG: adenylate/guanylate cyclase domain-containing protein [candidate division Zixibacteria bacterium]|nr:adenylate/guanylate cyclase domain-containing protein [candidate division Zixibacteria bacterium]
MRQQLLTPTPFKAGLAAVLLSCLLFTSFGADKPALLQALDNQLTSAMFRWRGAELPRHPIVIVDIDEKSLARIGQWPWSRDTVARLVEQISRQGAKVIGLDMMFIEPDRTSPKNFFQRYPQIGAGLAKLLPGLDHDQQLGDALAESASVLGYAMLTQHDGLKDPAALPFPSANLQLAAEGVGFDRLTLIPAYRATANHPAIAQALSEGFLNFFPESSGAVHKVPLLISLDGIPYPSLALEVARIALGEQALKVHPAPAAAGEKLGLLGVSIGERFVPTDDLGQMSVNFRGPWRTFNYLSASDLLETPHAELQGAVVLIGTSAAGLLDLQTTPLSRTIPGVEIHANIVDNLLAADPLKHDIFTEIGITLTLIVVGGILLSLLLARTGPLVGAFGALIILLAAVSGNYLLLFKNGSIVGLTYPLVTILLIWLLVTLANYLLVERQKQFVQGAFRHYLAPQVVEQLLQNPQQLSLAGEEKVLTVMFSDIRNFTSISEAMDSVALADFMNRYLTEMSRLIMAERGLIDKFIGDAVMAIWGAPLDDDEHALQAVKCALRMKEQTARLRRQWLAEGLPEINIGIGLNSGPMRVGNFGSEQLFDYTVIGDQVNLASRLEGLNKIYGTTILLSEQTRNQLAGEILCRPIDLVRVKGKQQSVEIFEPLCLGGADDPELRQWQRVLACYRQRQFVEARRELAILNRKSPQPLYQLYLQRIEQFLDVPPSADWDGCFIHQSK